MTRGILKYGLYLMIGGWMFVLGIVVGRGTSPVTFDTVSFQEHLRVIVGNIEPEAAQEEKVALDFYQELNKPVLHEVAAVPKRPTQKALKKADPLLPEADPAALPQEIPVKQSLKTASLKGKPTPAESDALPVKPAEAPKAKQKPEVSEAPVPEGSNGRYTIQVAAYKAFKDAVSQMSQLEKKGFSPYRIRAEKDGQTWYRVRMGSYGSYKAAQDALDKLKDARINGMIIKKDE